MPRTRQQEDLREAAAEARATEYDAVMRAARQRAVAGRGAAVAGGACPGNPAAATVPTAMVAARRPGTSPGANVEEPACKVSKRKIEEHKPIKLQGPTSPQPRARGVLFLTFA